MKQYYRPDGYLARLFKDSRFSVVKNELPDYLAMLSQ